MRVIPLEAMERARAPVLRRILRDSGRVGHAYRKVMSAIAAGLCERGFNMSKAWQKAGLSAYHTSDLGDDLGMKPLDYLRERHLEVAAFLLNDPSLDDVDLRDVADATGFVYKTFGKNFRAFSGQTPGEFRVDPCPRILQRLQRLEEDDDDGFQPETPFPGLGAALSGVHRQAAEATAQQTFDAAREAALTGRFETAVDQLSRALEDVDEHRLDDLAGPAHAYLGYALHQRSAVRAGTGHVDDAYRDLVDAAHHYLAAGRLPRAVEVYRRRVAGSHDPRDALLDNLCRRCRPRLLGPDGREVRQRLERALEPFPRDLPWLRDACDGCYRAVWTAVDLGRLALLDDAWQAVWIHHLADPLEPDAPPSLGRFVALLHAAQQITFGDQKRRADLCRQAVDVALRLKDPRREALARLHYGNALRAMGRHDEATAEFSHAKKECKGVPWLEAFRTAMVGSLKAQQCDHETAFANLRVAIDQYQLLDRHFAGIVCMQVGDLYYSTHRYTEALAAFRSSEPMLDGRRAPLMTQAVLPLNLTAAFNSLGEWDQAAHALACCDYDRGAQQGLWSMELVDQACLDLGRGHSREALSAFAQAKDICEQLQRWLDVALVALYTVEAYVAVNERLRAIESCAEALQTFRKVGCDDKTCEALARLRELLEPVAVDVAAVVACVRELARQHGGCLPVPA